MANAELQHILREVKQPGQQTAAKIPFDDLILPQLPVEIADVVETHREKLMDFGQRNHVCVAENVPMTEAMRIPEARAAIQAEWDKLIKQRCLMVETVEEYDDAKRKAQ